MRDIQLDIYRGLTIAYIVCIIHVVYWLDMASEPLRSLILFEMPIIFFISGAALKVSRSRKTFSQRIYGRFKRIVVPYLIYCAVCLLYVLLINPVQDTLGAKSLLRTLVDVLLGNGISGCPYCTHLWFICPYLLISCSFDLQCALLNKVHCGVYLTGCFAVFLLSQCFDIEIFKTLSGYNLFFMSGYCLYKELSMKSVVCIGLLSCCALICRVVFGGDFTPMQEHKFPPDILFILYGIFTISILSILLTYIKIPMCKIFTPWVKYGYEIYLYQNFFFIVLVKMLRFPLFEGSVGKMLIPIFLFAMVTISIPLILLLYRKAKSIILIPYRTQNKSD